MSAAGQRYAWLLLGALGCGRAQVEPGLVGCTTDLECKAPRLCVDGFCEDPRPVVGSGGTTGGVGGSSGAAASSAGAGTGGGAAGVAGTSMGGASTGGASASGGSAAYAGGVTVGGDPVRLEVNASAIAPDPVRGKLYAVVRGDAKMHASELVVIDAEHAVIEASVAVGPSPDTLAVSDDGTRLWVGLRGVGYNAPGTLREVDLTKWPPEPMSEYPVPGLYSEAEGIFVTGMTVLPGQPESLAVSITCSTCLFEVLVILDAGVPRPNRATSASPGDPVAGPPGYLFAFENSSTAFEFSTIRVDEAGASQTVSRGLIDGFDTRIYYDDGYVLASSGQVLDVSSPESPVRAGTFAYAGELVPHAEDSRVVMLSYAKEPNSSSNWAATNELVLRKLDLAAFRSELERPLAGRYGEVFDFVEVKPGLFAFIELRGHDSYPPDPRRGTIYLLAAPDVAD